MGVFNSATAVSKLEWDFTAHGGPRGFSTEPSAIDLDRFRQRFFKLATALTDELKRKISTPQTEEDTAPKTLREALQALDDVSGTEGGNALLINSEMLKVVVDVLGGNPTIDTLQALPGRVQVAFFGWVVGELLNPEAFASVTKSTLSLVRNA